MSVNNLVTDLNQIRLGDGISKIESKQIPPDRTLTGTSFKDGEIHFRFSVGGNNWWIPSKSFISMRTTLASTGTTAPTLASDMAPAPGYAACFWSGVELRIADTPISRVTSNVAQIEANHTRLMKSKNWVDVVGKSTNFWDSSYEFRKQSIVSNSISSEKKVKYVDLTGTSLAIATSGIPTGVATALNTELAVGDVIVVGGSRFTVLTAATDATGTTMTVFPAPAVAIAANADFHREITTYDPAGRQHNVVETTWRPPLGIFDIDHPLPPGDYDLVLTPNTSAYNESSIQVSAGVLGTKNSTMQSLYFNVAQIEASNIPDDFTYYLDLNETKVQFRPLASATNSEQNLDFTVEPTTFAMTVATQEIGAGSNPIYPPTLFKSGALQERNLTRLRVNFAGQTQPINETLDYSTPGTDYMTKLYHDMLINSDSYDESNGIGESKDDWLARGPMAYYKFSKPSNDGSTRVNVQMTLNTASTTNVMLFSHFKQLAKITYRGKRVESVSLDYA